MGAHTLMATLRSPCTPHPSPDGTIRGVRCRLCVWRCSCGCRSRASHQIHTPLPPRNSASTYPVTPPPAPVPLPLHHQRMAWLWWVCPDGVMQGSHQQLLPASTSASAGLAAGSWQANPPTWWKTCVQGVNSTQPPCRHTAGATMQRCQHASMADTALHMPMPSVMPTRPQPCMHHRDVLVQATCGTWARVSPCTGTPSRTHHGACAWRCDDAHGSGITLQHTWGVRPLNAHSRLASMPLQYRHQQNTAPKISRQQGKAANHDYKTK